MGYLRAIFVFWLINNIGLLLLLLLPRRPSSTLVVPAQQKPKGDDNETDYD